MLLSPKTLISPIFFFLFPEAQIRLGSFHLTIIANPRGLLILSKQYSHSTQRLLICQFPSM